MGSKIKDSTSSDLIAQIRRAFSDGFSFEVPPNGRLTTSRYDEGIHDFFTGREWSSLSPVEVRKHVAALSFFTPEAFCYYLPAFMLAELLDAETADVAGQFVVFTFGRPKFESQACYDARIALFTQDQKQAVLAFLDYMQERYGGFEDAVIYASGRLIS